MPALHVLSTKWHSLLPALIPHSVIRAHLLLRVCFFFFFGRQFLNWMSLLHHSRRTFTTTRSYLGQTTRRLRKPPKSPPPTHPHSNQVSLSARKEDPPPSIKLSLRPSLHPWVFSISGLRHSRLRPYLPLLFFSQCHHHTTSVWMSSCRAILALTCWHTPIGPWIHTCSTADRMIIVFYNTGDMHRGVICVCHMGLNGLTCGTCDD